MPLALHARVALSIAVAASLALLAGCSGKTIGDDLNQKADPTNPADGGTDAMACSAIAQACDPGDVAIPSPAICSGSTSCYSRPGVCGGPLLWCERIANQCDVAPACDPGDSQVGICPPPTPGPGGMSSTNCYSRTACGSSIECLHYNDCKALPACNPGDVEVTDPSQCMKQGFKCYGVTACNITIECTSAPTPVPVPPPQPGGF